MKDKRKIILKETEKAHEELKQEAIRVMKNDNSELDLKFYLKFVWEKHLPHIYSHPRIELSKATEWLQNKGLEVACELCKRIDPDTFFYKKTISPSRGADCRLEEVFSEKSYLSKQKFNQMGLYSKYGLWKEYCDYDASKLASMILAAVPMLIVIIVMVLGKILGFLN